MPEQEIRRGEIYLCDFGEPVGHESSFRRPALVVSAAPLNRHEMPIVIPITSKQHNYPSHVELDGILDRTSYLQCELITVVDGRRLIHRLGTINPATMSLVETILRRLLVL